MNDEIEKIRELILEDEKFFQIVKDIKKNNNRYYIKDTYLDTPEWIIGAHDHRVFLLDEIERLREALKDIARGDYSDPMCKLTPEARARAALEGGR